MILKVGDVIRTVRPVTTGNFEGQRIRVKLLTDESVVKARKMIAAGRWEVEPEGRCQRDQ